MGLGGFSWLKRWKRDVVDGEQRRAASERPLFVEKNTKKKDESRKMMKDGWKEES